MVGVSAVQMNCFFEVDNCFIHPVKFLKSQSLVIQGFSEAIIKLSIGWLGRKEVKKLKEEMKEHDEIAGKKQGPTPNGFDQDRLNQFRCELGTQEPCPPLDISQRSLVPLVDSLGRFMRFLNRC